jgi:hypothetical protein
MTDRYGYVTPAQLASADDPVEILADADSLDALLALDRFDPDGASVWARAKVRPTDHTVEVRNARTGERVAASACELDS